MEHVGARELAEECDEARIGAQVGEFVGGGLEGSEGRLGSIRRQERSAERRCGPGCGGSIAPFAMARDRGAQERLRVVVMRGRRGALAGSLEELGFLGRIGRDREGLAQEGDGLFLRAEGGGARGGGLQRDPGLGGQRFGFRPLCGVLVRCEVVAGEGAGELVGAEALEEPGGSEVAALAISLGERVVGDLADEGLDERVLAAFGAARVRLQHQELAAHEPVQARLQVGLGDTRHGREAGEGERLAEHGRVGH